LIFYIKATFAVIGKVFFLTMRILAEARGAYRKAFLEQMVQQSAGQIEVCLHFGDKNSDFDVPSLMRQEVKSARAGRLVQKPKYTGANLQLIASEEFHSSAEIFADQLHRASSKYVVRSHKMLNLHEYIDYYHILSDAIGAKIIERKITHAVFFDIPHLAIDTLIYDLCVAMNIKVIILTQFFPDKLFSMSRIEHFGKCSLSLDGAPKYPLDDTGQGELSYMDNRWQQKGPKGRLKPIHALNLISYLARKSPSSLLNYRFIAHTFSRLKGSIEALPVWRDPFGRFFDHNYLDYLEYLVEFENNPVDYGTPYIYVPLHLQPEMTTSALGGIYRDQLLMIEHLLQLLPNGWKILVKENPKQGPFARGAMFFHRLNRLEHVSMVPSDTDTKQLTKNSKLVVTVTGTAAWEAIQMGVPAITFGNAWFNSLPGIVPFKPDLDLIQISRQNIDREKLSYFIGALFERCHKGNIDKGYFRASVGFNKETNAEMVGQLLVQLLTEQINFTFLEKANA
jgi:hypothetical protein